MCLIKVSLVRLKPVSRQAPNQHHRLVFVVTIYVLTTFISFTINGIVTIAITTTIIINIIFIVIVAVVILLALAIVIKVAYTHKGITNSIFYHVTFHRQGALFFPRGNNTGGGGRLPLSARRTSETQRGHIEL